MRILFLILLVSNLGGCASWGTNNRYVSSNPSRQLDAGSIGDLTAKVQTLSIVSPAEEAQLALAVQRARDLHAQLRAYDAAIAAAQQRQSKLKARFPQIANKTNLTKQSALGTQSAALMKQKQAQVAPVKVRMTGLSAQLPGSKPAPIELTRSRGLRASIPTASLLTTSRPAVSKREGATTPAASVSLASGAVQRVADGFNSKEHRFETQNFVAATPSAQKANANSSIGRVGSL